MTNDLKVIQTNDGASYAISYPLTPLPRPYIKIIRISKLFTNSTMKKPYRTHFLE